MSGQCRPLTKYSFRANDTLSSSLENVLAISDTTHLYKRLLIIVVESQPTAERYNTQTVFLHVGCAIVHVDTHHPHMKG